MTDPDRKITDNSGAVATGNTIGGDLNQYVNSTVLHQYFREVIRRLRLDPAYVRELLRTYEPPPGRDQAAEVLDRHHAVVLIGGEGTGRRTTAVQLLHERNVTLHELVPEPGQDLTAEPPCEPRCGYLYAADALDATSIQDYAARLRDNDSYLVVWTTQDVTQHTGTFAADVGIHLEPPLPENVFRRNLTARLLPAEATWWRDRQDLEPIIKGAHPADVVRLVKLIPPTMAVHGCTEAAVADLIEAYRSWEGYLQTRFAPSALHLRERVRLIAVALVENAPEQTAYEAATALAERLGVPTEEGHGLAGAGTRCLRDGGEIRCDDGVVRFAKPAFAESVLEYVARTYPEVWRQVREWTIELPRRLSSDPDAPAVLARLARTVVQVAGRRNDLELVRRATEGWSTSGTRPLAVEMLGMAAVDTTLGRGTRQWMYDSAYHRRGTVPTLTAIAEACARYGTVYPDNALTRLRHLAAVEQETVRNTVRQAVTDLAGDDRVRVRILDGLGTWLQGTKGRAVGCEAFLDVMETRDDQDRFATIGEAARRRTDRLMEALRKGWGAALVEPATTDRARTLIATWLDDALVSLEAGDVDRPRVVVGVLGQAAREDPRYLPRLVRAVDAWYARSEQTPDCKAFSRTLIDTATSNDPLMAAQREEDKE
ncbi:hypothetical protein [Actinoallomurus soli]|uniref:hypothetical protein n=1 Tax=Actinoallomurus soli TaxID=2952535 RepID=UPI002093AB3D|nr:hypothetical protein [Actinoallomurus soli]MCO5968944.1 hypothetical protein [Actinoallomurus soli]